MHNIAMQHNTTCKKYMMHLQHLLTKHICSPKLLFFRAVAKLITKVFQEK